jgi:hypothetical protein
VKISSTFTTYKKKGEIYTIQISILNAIPIALETNLLTNNQTLGTRYPDTTFMYTDREKKICTIKKEKSRNMDTIPVINISPYNNRSIIVINPVSQYLGSFYFFCANTK